VSDQLTTTSYAMLGLLAIKPWTAYELAKQMERSLRHFWPRAESRVYEEPKRLARLGLARATAQTVGQRPKTLYTITPKGRRALARWLEERGDDPKLESEALLKVFFSDHGTKDSALANIAAIREWAIRRTVENIRIPRSYLDGDLPFPERLAQIIVVGRFLTDFTDMVHEWAEWATMVVDGWPDKPARAEPDWETLRQVAGRPLPGSVSDTTPDR
jgi:PadR family transcriptional regulator, regulatory protein AphA